MSIPRVAARPASMLLVALLCVAFHATFVRAQDKNQPLRIVSMQAQLFMMREGAFGEDLIGSGRADIVWNVGVSYSADTFLVIVKVMGPSILREPLPRLVFTATTGRRVILSQTARIFNAIGDGTYHAAFLVPTTGCDPVKLSARIPGQRKPATMTKLINSQCGE
jgi:hypothetical protein